jgi:hypothetical protein
MTDLKKHGDAMLQLIRDYAERQGFLEEMSGLLIIREALKPDEPERPLNMVITGEEPSLAIQTLHYAGVILTAELRELTKQAISATVKA